MNYAFSMGPILEMATRARLSFWPWVSAAVASWALRSDIDLMFVYRGNGQTNGQKVITTGEFFEKLVQMS